MGPPCGSKRRLAFKTPSNARNESLLNPTNINYSGQQYHHRTKIFPEIRVKTTLWNWIFLKEPDGNPHNHETKLFGGNLLETSIRTTLRSWLFSREPRYPRRPPYGLAGSHPISFNLGPFSSCSGTESFSLGRVVSPRGWLPILRGQPSNKVTSVCRPHQRFLVSCSFEQWSRCAAWLMR